MCGDRSLGLDTGSRGTAKTAQGLGHPDREHRRGRNVSEVGPWHWGQKRTCLRPGDDGDGVSESPPHLEGDEIFLKEPHLGREASPPIVSSLATSDVGHMSGPFFISSPF